jgi:hypothetical protein
MKDAVKAKRALSGHRSSFLVRPGRAFIVLIVGGVLWSCDPVGERRLAIPLSAASAGHSTARQLGIAQRIADQMAQRHGWIRETVSAEQRARGVLRLYSIHLGDYTMHCELLSTGHEILLDFRDWTSLREANEANRRMRDFDREFHQAIGEPQSPDHAIHRTADRPYV